MSEKDESYYKLIELSLLRYPNLKYLCEELQRQYSASPEIRDIGRAALYELGDGGTQVFKTFNRASELRRHLASTNRKAPQRRLFILEDIIAGYVELVGKELLLDPLTFAEHLRDTTYTESNLRSNGPKLPSSYKAGQSFCIVYYEVLRNIPYGVVDFSQIFAVSNVYRKIKNNFDNPDDRVGIVARKATFWSRGSAEDWDAVLLLDPPVLQVTDQWAGYREGKKLDVPKSPHKLYQDGYIDFTPWPENSTNYQELQGFVVNGPRRSSPFDDFHYYCTCFPYQEPNPTAFDSVRHIRRIALANWMLLIEYLQRNYLKSDFERNMDQYRKIDDVSKLQAHQYTIQRRQVTMNIWIRRWSSVYPENIKAAMRRLGFRSRQDCMDQVDEYEDWNYLLTKITELAAALIRTSDNLTTHMDWIENQMAQQQSRDINRLTWLGAIFLPLSFVSSIFSMGEQFAPGGRFFWIYFVVAIPSMIVVSLLVMPDKFRQRARNRALERLDRTLRK